MTSATQFERQGYLLYKEPLVSAEVITGAVAGMDQIRHGVSDTGRPPCASPWKPGDDTNKLCKIENPQFASKGIRRLLQQPAIGETIARATGAEMVQVWWVQLLYKPSTSSDTPVTTGVGWHLDWTYWQGHWVDGSELMTAWFALSDVEDDCGPMRFVDGSNHWSGLEGGDFFAQELNHEGFTVPPGEQWHETPAILPLGGMSLHHKLTLHGSGPNTSGRPRRSLAIHVRTEKSRPRGNVEGTIVADDLSGYIDDLELCPIIYGERVASAFERD
ncbi:MAG: phytanoyl-CoA dioxygenase family protein [Lentisphaerae bacterium]|nr:phytanoyl-CoA dioxygenase family protein [Lentisphaerota bacterium]